MKSLQIEGQANQAFARHEPARALANKPRLRTTACRKPPEFTTKTGNTTTGRTLIVRRLKSLYTKHILNIHIRHHSHRDCENRALI
ncbi:MAG: hypothetical protein RIS76_2027 [Verrucomicrobiota bacterium]|jgi:hypothetical protein